MLDDLWLGEQLKANGLVTLEQLSVASQKASGDLSRDLIASGSITEPALLRFLGLQFQTRYLSTEKLSSAKIPQWVLDLLTEEYCETNQILPVRCDRQRKVLSIVTPNPSEAQLLDQVKATTKVQGVKAYVALPYAILAGIRKFYRGDLHAFSRMDQSLRADYSDMLNIYEQRLIDFEPEGGASLELPGPQEQGLDTGDFQTMTPAAPAPAPVRSAPLDMPVGSNATLHGTPAPPIPAAAPAAREANRRTTDAPATKSTFLRTCFTQTVELLVSQLEEGKDWRVGHSAEVARIADQLASRSGLEPDARFHLNLAALLHDLGKPASAHLTVYSMELQPDHRQQGSGAYGALSTRLPNLPGDVVRTIEGLYERNDGKGVPGRAAGSSIPIGARLLATADCYVDLLSNPAAPGGQCRNHQMAIDRLRQAASTGALDPTIVGYLAEMGSPQPDAQRTPGGPLILIIDADPQASSILGGHLKSEGFDSIVVETTGDAALALLSEDVKLVVAEVDLKPMDGFTFTEWLHSNERTQHIPFMFISSRSSAEDINRGFEVGAMDYIVKPFMPEVVMAKIKRAVN